jgi:excisionase family DNA binding protein
VSQASRSDRSEPEISKEIMGPELPQPEWLDLKALTVYACISERTVREWIHRAVGPLPASRVGTKILVRRSMFDRWLEGHQVKSVDITCIVDELVTAVKRTN